MLTPTGRPCHAKLQHPQIRAGWPPASFTTPYGLQAGLRRPGAPWPLCLSVPVCRMGRLGGTSATRSYTGQPSLLTLVGGPAERGLAAESGQQRPLTRSSPPSRPGSAPETQRASETRAPAPRATYEVHQPRGLRHSTLRASRLAYSLASLQARARPPVSAWPPVRVQVTTLRLPAQAQNEKEGGGGERVLGVTCSFVPPREA